MFSQRLDGRKPSKSNRGNLKIYQVTAVALGVALLGGCGTLTDQAQAPQTSEAPLPTVPLPSASPSEPSSAEAAPSPAAESSAAASGQAAAEPRTEDERCHTSMLSGSAEHGESGAGQRYAELTLTNTSGETCTLYGYGGMQLIGADGAEVPTKMERTPDPAPQVVRLAPGESASSTLHWTAVPHEGESEQGQCQPKPVSALVTPPDERDPLSVSWDLGSVCGFGSIDNSAYRS